uniref:hypothetical protein n=1 Tax=uncultured Sphingomonas sp. TaxID=158754 RepID=UPI0025DB89C7|nr:hypothetical protein [uncultured Sphingomonas sp.]
MGLASYNILESRWHLLTEFLLLLLVLAAALVWPKSKASGALNKVESVIVALADRPWLGAFLVGGLAVALRAALLPVLGPPVPYIADEFSILLQGQTFASGRLSMPTHPLHQFFESYYVNQVPSYASMYFPGRGAPLGLGLLLFGSPWPGVWLSMVALCMSVPWMLRAWVSKPLALVGGVLVVLKFGVLSGWINSYFGGGFSALGGVLVLGAYPRLMREPKWRDGVALAAGLFILMISRPFEGMLFSLPFGVVLFLSFIRRLSSREPMTAARIGLPTMLSVSAGLLVLLSTNAASTGSMLEDPYSLHRSTHAVAPPFLFQEPIVPSQALPANMARGYQAEAEPHVARNSLRGVVGKAVSTFRRLFEFYVGPLLAIPFLVGLFLIRRIAVFVASGLLLSLGILANTWDWSHYWAPGFGLFIVLIMKGLGRLREWRFRSRESGLFLSRALPCAAAAMTLIPSAAVYAGAPRPEPEAFFRSCCAVHTQTPRSMILDQLQATPGKDLVLVRHRADEQPFMTLVANEPDIDGAEIIWAHDLGHANRRLLDYYPDRNVWRVGGMADTHAVLQRPASIARR